MKLSYRTCFNTTPFGKAKVYFTAHPEDYAACFERIADELLRCKDCAVFYDEEPTAACEPAEIAEMLSEMNLFVMPVTENFLRSGSRARSVEYRIAREKHIPVLLLIEDARIAAKSDRLNGNHQVLSRYLNDDSGRPYLKILSDYLDAVLFHEELAEKVRASFESHIFLGCRKKDRKAALQLMHLIHSNPMCRETGIRFDEYSEYNDAADALRKSDLFVLAVTPGLLEPDNYIMRVLYPMAKAAGIPIIPAELQATDRYMLETDYRDLPECISRRDIPDRVGRELSRVAAANPYDSHSPQHDFYIGLAYLNGIDVETDHETALRLIKGSAESGLPEAMTKLADMYRYGIGVEKDMQAAVEWQEKVLDLYRKELDNSLREPGKDQENEEKAKTDKVNFSVLSPKAVKADSYGIIDLYMYTEAERIVVEEAIRDSSGLVRETKKPGFEVRRGTSISARLESRQAEISDPLETQTWNGDSLHFDFQFYVPMDCDRSQIAFTCYIECNGIPITRLNFMTAVSRFQDNEALPAKVTQSDYKKAFISYSRKDEQRMLERVVGIQELAPEMKFWLDKQSLDAGDLWREEIKKAITISDVLLLFWSVPASQSKEVENEWTYALEQKGLSFIAPVPLDPPNMCPPPAQLKALNFTVRAFYQNELTKKLSYYDSNNIILV